MTTSTDIQIFYAMGLSWFLAQFIKACIEKRRTPEISWLKVFFWHTGGMPSSHSALVLAITTYIGFTVGFFSYLFALSLGFSAITIRDSLGIRYSVGEIINRIGEIETALSKETHITISKSKLKALRGHKPLEVLSGMAVGFAAACLFIFIV